jgi:hypothetical protein
MALKDSGIILPDGDIHSHEGDIASSIAQLLSNGEEGVRC